MERTTYISLEKHFENFVDSMVATGRFKNVSEVIRAGLRLLEEEETRIIVLKKAIKEGIDSGLASSLHPEKHLTKLKSARKK